MIDGVDAFHAAFARGEVTAPPRDYMDLILIPSLLHTPSVQFWEQPWVIQEQTRWLLMRYIAAGWAGNMNLVRRDPPTE